VGPPGQPWARLFGAGQVLGGFFRFLWLWL